MTDSIAIWCSRASALIRIPRTIFEEFEEVARMKLQYHAIINPRRLRTRVLLKY